MQISFTFNLLYMHSSPFQLSKVCLGPSVLFLNVINLFGYPPIRVLSKCLIQLCLCICLTSKFGKLQKLQKLADVSEDFIVFIIWTVTHLIIKAVKTQKRRSLSSEYKSQHPHRNKENQRKISERIFCLRLSRIQIKICDRSLKASKYVQQCV